MQTKKFYVSKTVFVGVIEIIIGILLLVVDFLKAGQYDPAAYVLLTVGVLTIIMRFLTKGPISW